MTAAATDDLLAPFVPTADDPFDLAKAGHLLRRAGFGGSIDDRHRLVRDGVERAVERLFEAGSGEDVDAAFQDVLALGELDQMRAYRVWRMLAGRQRLRERMSLFWHDHFATSNQKVKNVRMMGRQLQLFDELGLARFDDLLLAVSKDPAMVRWLDNESNVRGRPNENFARELFELFGLGQGNYTEADIQQAARAFTGWHLRGERFAFKRRYFDGGDKTLFGRTGRFTGEDVVRMTVEHEASPGFLAGKLLAFFVHPQPAAEEIDALAKVYADKQRHVGDTLKVLLRSKLFFGRRAYRSKVKSPADLVVGMVRCLGADASPQELGEAMRRLGQALLEPPNVAGWPGERAWITSASWLLRNNFASRLAGGAFKLQPGAGELLAGGDPAERAIELLLDGDVSAESRRAIERVAAKTRNPADILHAVQCLPEGQML